VGLFTPALVLFFFPAERGFSGTILLLPLFLEWAHQAR
jgi:hypothetical protein